MEQQSGSWRCPQCGGFVAGGNECTWPKKGETAVDYIGGRSTICSGVRPNPNRHAVLRGRMAGRGIGNRPAGWHPPEK